MESADFFGGSQVNFELTVWQEPRCELLAETTNRDIEATLAEARQPRPMWVLMVWAFEYDDVPLLRYSDQMEKLEEYVKIRNFYSWEIKATLPVPEISLVDRSNENYYSETGRQFSVCSLQGAGLDRAILKKLWGQGFRTLGQIADGGSLKLRSLGWSQTSIRKIRYALRSKYVRLVPLNESFVA
jgi:hypothetical protein